MTKAQYLYGDDVDPSLWETMTYPEALKHKAQLAYNNIGVLHKTHYMKTDSLRVNECHRAIRFNEDLIKEMQNDNHNKD